MLYEHVITNAKTGEVTVVPFTQAEIDALQPTFESTVSTFESLIQAHLDTEANTRGYDSITTACSYSGAPNPFQAEAMSFVTWRGNVWAYCYQELAKVEAGTRPMPTIEEIIYELPSRT